MNNALVTFLFLIITISMALGILVYYSTSSSIIEAKTNPLYVAEDYSKGLEVSSTQPVINYIIPQHKCQPINFTVNFILTVNIPGYQGGKLYLIPFLMPSNYNPYDYVPTSIPNQVSNPNYVGYVSIKIGDTQLKPIIFNNDVYFLNQQQGKIEAYAFCVCNGQTLNVTFVTSLNETPVIWIIANICGQMYRLAYPYFISLSKGINTANGLITSPPLTYYELYQKELGCLAILFSSSSCSHVVFYGNDKIKTNHGNIGYFAKKGYLCLDSDIKFCCVCELYLGKCIKVCPPSAHKYLPKCCRLEYVPPCPCVFINPIYQYYNPSNCQEELQSKINNVQFCKCTTTVSCMINNHFIKYCNGVLYVCKPIRFCEPLSIERYIWINKQTQCPVKCIIFKCPVIFDNGFIDKSDVNLKFCKCIVSEGLTCVGGIACLTFEKGALFICTTNKNSGELILSGTNTEQECGIHIISCGPFIAYFECAPGSIVKLNGVHLQDKNNIISFTAKNICIFGVDKICSCYPLFIQAPAHNTINFCHVTICGGLVLESDCHSTLTFEANNELCIKKGPLIIDTGSCSYLTMDGRSEIHVCGYALIKANTITLHENAKIVTSKYDLFYGCRISFCGDTIVVCNNQPPQGKLSQIVIYPTITSSFGVAGWFSIFPNDTEVNYLNIKLSNNCCTFCMFLNISPLNNGKYNITPIIHPSSILSSSSGAKPLRFTKPTCLIVEQGAKIFYNIYVSFSGCHVGISIYLYTQCSKEYHCSTCTWCCGTSRGYIGVPKDSHLSVSLYGEPTYQVLLYEETQPQAVYLMEYCGPYVKLNLNCETPVEYFYLISSCINDNILTPTYSNINNGYCIYHVTYIC
ncbi:hypothetical protein Ahos_1859 [Acidianus hospitalis W1]|uniref:Uncharacterized protein n=1 Tax=Acidianus hospitalis (strain W1) TaxID=933801 RepID=F4B7B2_ACIHW|nr:hypothetical protein [Acidianus hospitalis]AEE94732.1 hypothetical protein Ahos_1859 [Acidianus hospitalis W1]